MKKHMIAVAVAAAVASPAMAQVTVSGTIDSSYQSLKKNGTEEQNQTIVGSSLRSSNNLRISGAEDLGGGLKAHFLLEEALASDTGTRDSAFSRGAFVGVSGGFGTINIGKPNSTFISAMPTFNTWGGNVNALATADGVTSTSVTTVTGRPDNSIQYISPSFNGMSANVVFSQGGEGTSAATKDNGTQMQFNLTGKVGALSFIIGTAEQDTATALSAGTTGLIAISNSTSTGFYSVAASDGTQTLVGGVAPTGGTANTTYTHTARVASADATTGKIRNTGLGLTYDFGMAQVTYSMMEGKTTRSNVTGDLYKFRSQGVYAQIPMGAYSTFVSFREFENKTQAATNLDHSAYTVGVTYSLSKRTNVYALYDRVKNDSASAQITRGGAAASVGEDPSQFAIGLRHSF